jgi:hypothetical protein
VAGNSPEMRQFARSAFLLSRQCGLAGVPEGARTLFLLARDASGRWQREVPELLLYGLMARLIGWRKASQLSLGLRQLLPRRVIP